MWTRFLFPYISLLLASTCGSKYTRTHIVIILPIHCSHIVCRLIGEDDGELGKAFLVRLSINGGTCTAAIIGDNWVLTAAHCVEELYNDVVKLGRTQKTMYGDPVIHIFDVHHQQESYFVSMI